MSEDRTEEIVDLLISDVVYPGRGIARLDNFVIFVPGVITGEKVRARITSRRKNFAEAQLLEVIEPAASRVEPECPLAMKALSGTDSGHPTCPGCTYQHMSYEEEVRIKDAQLTNMIERLGGGAPEGVHIDPVAAPTPFHYRNKIVMHAATCSGKRSIGYISEDNQTVIPVTACPLARPEINEGLRNMLADTAFLERLTDRDNITLRFTANNGVHYWSERQPCNERWFSESTVIGDIRVPAAGFFQVNVAIADQLLKALKETVTRIEPDAVIDLYCGSGLFSIAAAEASRAVVLGIDIDQRAIKAARYNAHGRGLSRMDFLAAPAARVTREALTRVTDRRTLLVADPPRRGLEKRVLQIIAEHGPGHLIYLSCSPDTLARDLKTLRKSGYAIKSRRVFDMFPRTAHFESLVLLSREP